MSNFTPHQILNVDDNDAGRYVTTRALRQAGFTVIEAATGAEALQMALQQPDLVLLDVNLPDIGGFEVCRRLKADPQTQAIPIVHHSAIHVHVDALVMGLEGGADGYLVQPVEPRGLIATIRAFIRIKDTESKLRESEERFRKVFEEGGLGMAMADLTESRFIRVNRAFCEMLGYTEEELTGKTAAEVVHPDQRAADAEVTRGLREAKIQKHTIETRYLKKNGEVVWATRTLTKIQRADDQSVYTLAMVDDITERRIAEAEIARQLDELRRWKEATLGRERRVLEVKQEVNALLARLGEPPRYASVRETDGNGGH